MRVSDYLYFDKKLFYLSVLFKHILYDIIMKIYNFAHRFILMRICFPASLYFTITCHRRKSPKLSVKKRRT